jgi:hypothetical protein
MNATNDNVVVPCERDTRTLTEAKLEPPLQLGIVLQIVRRVLVRHEATTEVIKRPWFARNCLITASAKLLGCLKRRFAL